QTRWRMMPTCSDRGDRFMSKLICWLENSTTVLMMLKLICLEPTAPLSIQLHSGRLRKLKVAYNDCLRILLKKPRSTRASQLFCNMGLTTFMALLRNLTFKFMSQLDCSTHFIIYLMTDPGRSSVKYTSKIWEHWHECLF